MNHFVWKGKNLFVSTKGRFLSEFDAAQKNVLNHYPEQKI